MNTTQLVLSALFGNGVPKYNRVVTAEIVLTNVATRGGTFQFPTGTVLGNENVLVYGLQAFTAGQQTISPGGATVIPANAATSLIIDVVDTNSDHRINQSPYFNWISSLNLGYPYMLNPFRIQMDKSLITVVDTANLTANQVALIGLLYFTQQDLTKILTAYYGAADAAQMVQEYYNSIV